MKKEFKYLHIVFAIYLTSMLASYTLCNRVSVLFGVHIVSSTLVYAICIVLGDIVAEVYGFAAFKRITWTSIFCAILFALLLEIVNQLPGDPGYIMNMHYDAVIKPILFVSITGILGIIAGQFIDAYFLLRWKILTQGRFFWLRSVGSTAIGSFVMTWIGYINRLYELPFSQALHFILASYAVKLLIAALFALPITVIAGYLKTIEPQELLTERNFKFNPFTK